VDLGRTPVSRPFTSPDKPENRQVGQNSGGNAGPGAPIREPLGLPRTREHLGMITCRFTYDT
jgi:hypothetical protein